jgi:hypothetical protein
MAGDAEIIFGPAFSFVCPEDFFRRPVMTLSLTLATDDTAVAGVGHDDGQGFNFSLRHGRQNQIVRYVERRASFLSCGEATLLIAAFANPGEMLAPVLANNSVKFGVLIYAAVFTDAMFF